MRFDQNVRIRFNIMMIALLGGLGFLCYLLVNVHLANANKDRLDDLVKHRYPVLEQIRQIKQQADAIRENLTAAEKWKSFAENVTWSSLKSIPS